MTLKKNQHKPNDNRSIYANEVDGNEVFNGEFFSWHILPKSKGSPYQQVVISIRGISIDIYTTLDRVLERSSFVSIKEAESRAQAVFCFDGKEYVLFEERLDGSGAKSSSTDIKVFNKHAKASSEWRRQLLEASGYYTKSRAGTHAPMQIVYVTKDGSPLKWILTAAAVAIGVFAGLAIDRHLQDDGSGDMCYIDEWNDRTTELYQWEEPAASLNQNLDALTSPRIEDQERVKRSDDLPQAEPAIKSELVATSYKSNSTDQLVKVAEVDAETLQNLMKLSIFNSIPLGDLHKEGNKPYLAFTRITDTPSNLLLSSTEAQGHTGLLIPFDLDAENDDTQSLAIARTVVAYCSRNADVDQLAIILALNDFSEQSVVQSQQGGYRQKNAPPIGQCEWETVLSNMGAMKAMLDITGVVKAAGAPFIVASNGAVLSLPPSITAQGLTQWLNQN